MAHPGPSSFFLSPPPHKIRSLSFFFFLRRPLVHPFFLISRPSFPPLFLLPSLRRGEKFPSFLCAQQITLAVAFFRLTVPRRLSFSLEKGVSPSPFSFPLLPTKYTIFFFRIDARGIASVDSPLPGRPLLPFCFFSFSEQCKVTWDFFPLLRQRGLSCVPPSRAKNFDLLFPLFSSFSVANTYFVSTALR